MSRDLWEDENILGEETVKLAARYDSYGCRAGSMAS